MSRGGLTTGPFYTSQQTRDGVGSMLGHCHGPWANVEPTSGQCSLGWSLVIGFTQQTQDVDPMPVQWRTIVADNIASTFCVCCVCVKCGFVNLFFWDRNPGFESPCDLYRRAVHCEKAVSAYFTREQILHYVFVEQNNLFVRHTDIASIYPFFFDTISNEFPK